MTQSTGSFNTRRLSAAHLAADSFSYLLRHHMGYFLRMRRSFIEINAEFQKALDVMEGTNRHIFITGKAGTGKSTLLEYFRQNTRKEVAVLAPTGVAALNVQGQTIHSFFGFKPTITPEKVKRMAGPEARIYKEFDTIIIDEISMVRADLLDCVEKFLRLNGPYRKQWFGGVQMIFVGDLYQLPPVVASSEREIFTHRYDSPYFFSAQVFKEKSFEIEFIELEKVYRQTEQDFIELLNAIRNRTCTDDDIERLNRNHRPDAPYPTDGFYITLTTTNDLAAKRNLEMLEALPDRAFTLPGKTSGVFDRSSLPAEEALILKPGAQVMLVNNDKYGRWVNGTLGTVKGLSRMDGEDDRVLVRLDDGKMVEVTPNMWELFEYQYDRKTKGISTRTTGTFIQYPIRLAWAVTIHKSQGKTFDRVIIDMGRGAFAHGQVYVALSRCTNFNGIFLTKMISKGHIRMDWRVAKFLTTFQYEKADERSSYDERSAIIMDAIRRDLAIEIIYLKPNDTKSCRTIRPLSIEPMEFKGRQFEGLRAYCELRKEERTFRIDRILEINYTT
ncbi:MAG: AAA family ATPase [Syntrophorhabdaceae bacterium]|nr:AAA family ATPase [Syntrophorhabdaceae bacterium]